ncbi:MAG TPA: hypothetical protein G4O16_06430 [Dehalococcoidia bacterium]|nr:hypothetical protein [Dehalococcoidia bacterium]
MKLTYDGIVKWMTEYFKVYSTYGQDAATADRMKDYFAPDLRFIPYIAGIGGPEGGFFSRDEFIHTAKSHSAWYEKLTPINLTVDERKKAVVALFGMEVIDRKTGEVAVKKSAIAHYELVLDEDNTIKIKTIRFFWEVLPPGVHEFYDLYEDDA